MRTVSVIIIRYLWIRIWKFAPVHFPSCIFLHKKILFIKKASKGNNFLSLYHSVIRTKQTYKTLKAMFFHDFLKNAIGFLSEICLSFINYYLNDLTGALFMLFVVNFYYTQLCFCCLFGYSLSASLLTYTYFTCVL